jgi:hypothetical protein
VKCIRCGHSEEAHETREYRGDKSRACFAHDDAQRCGCRDFSDTIRIDTKALDLLVAANQLVSGSPGRYPYLEAAVRAITKAEYEPDSVALRETRRDAQ